MRSLPLALALVACKPRTPTETDLFTPTPPSTHVPTDTAPPTPTGDTGPGIPVFDCSNLPTAPFPNDEQVADARGYHGLAFDQLGNLVGSNGTSLVILSAPGNASQLAANLGQLEQMAYLPSGELVVSRSANGNIVGVMPDGQTRVIATNINAYGVLVGPDGFIYTANQDRVHRIDPTTGQAAVYVDLPGNVNPKVIDFSPSLDRLYIGTNSNSGRVYVVDLDANLDQVGDAQVFANNVGQTWHDGLGVDVCGNLYVNEYFASGLYRITPDGAVSTLASFQNNSSQYAHGIVWGSGIGPWPATQIYVPQPYNNNRVRTVDIGIPYRTFNDGVYELIGL